MGDSIHGGKENPEKQPGGPRGIWSLLIGLVIGAALGLVTSMIIIQMAQIEETKELYSSDTSSLNMLYQGRNMQEYLKLAGDELIREFVETGGPRECGTVRVNNRSISIWEAPGCEVSGDGVLERSGELAAREASRYEVWGTKASADQGRFCLSINNKLAFGEYHSKICFDSPLNEAMETTFGQMKEAYESGSAECSCLETYKLCWTDLDGMNFTYALMENC